MAASSVRRSCPALTSRKYVPGRSGEKSKAPVESAETDSKARACLLQRRLRRPCGWAAKIWIRAPDNGWPPKSTMIPRAAGIRPGGVGAQEERAIVARRIENRNEKLGINEPRWRLPGIYLLNSSIIFTKSLNR